MRLLVLGRTAKEEQHFLARAVRTGYSVSVLTPKVDTALQAFQGLTLWHKPALTEQDLGRALQDIDAVIVTAQCAKNQVLVRILTRHMQHQGIQRLIIITKQLDQSELAAELNATAIDWTIVQHTSQKNNLAVSIKDLALFLVSQITEVRHLRSAVLITS